MTLPSIVQPLDLADVGVFGGSGFYSLLDGAVEEVSVQTPYGAPSAPLAIGRVGETRVAFLPRHGPHHRIPPHEINYRANVWAMASVGVTRLIAPTAAGSLQAHVKPGELVVCDQLVDRTTNRLQTYFDGPRVVHVSFADPYCDELRRLVVEASRESAVVAHERGTVVVVQGPRFSTRAESRWYSALGWEVINMTQYPEAALARELEICYVNIALITDFDAGLQGDPAVAAVSVGDVVKVMQSNNHNVRRVIERAIPRIPRQRTCPCAHALQHAVVS